MLSIVLMSNEQITEGAVATCLVEREYLHWIDMDYQRKLPLVHLVVALWALCKPHILIGIEKEVVTRGLLAQLCHGLLFSICHWYRATPF